MGCLTFGTAFVVIVLLILKAFSIIKCAWIWCFSPLLVFLIIVIFAVIIDKVREDY